MNSSLAEILIATLLPELNDISLQITERELQDDLHYGRPGRPKTQKAE